MVGDPIADLITRLKNASMVGHQTVVLPYSKLKESIALTLKTAGFVGDISKEGEGVQQSLVVTLMYDKAGAPRIKGVQRISKPGRRLYAGVKDIHPVKYGKGILVLSTPRGILVDADARKVRVGGETLFKMW
ncbi:MAG: 30S ribosomal protein S8 [Patescibacteria group bacterium]